MSGVVLTTPAFALGLGDFSSPFPGCRFEHLRETELLGADLKFRADHLVNPIAASIT